MSLSHAEQVPKGLYISFATPVSQKMAQQKYSTSDLKAQSQEGRLCEALLMIANELVGLRKHIRKQDESAMSTKS